MILQEFKEVSFHSFTEILNKLLVMLDFIMHLGVSYSNLACKIAQI